MPAEECFVHSQRGPHCISYITPKFFAFLFVSVSLCRYLNNAMIQCNSNPLKDSYFERNVRLSNIWRSKFFKIQIMSLYCVSEKQIKNVPKVYKELKTKLRNSGQESKQIDRMREDCSRRVAILTKQSNSTSSPCERDRIC